MFGNVFRCYFLPHCLIKNSVTNRAYNCDKKVNENWIFYFTKSSGFGEWRIEERIRLYNKSR